VFTPDDRSDAVILSDGLWRRQFGADAAIVGRNITLMAGRLRERTERTLTVVGVLPRRFHFTYPQETELYMLRSWSEVERTTLQAQTAGTDRAGIGR
jgi:hypothetical protein